MIAVARSAAAAWNLPQFWTGLLAGTATAFVLLAAAMIASRAHIVSRRWIRPAPIAGLAFTAAGLWSVHRSHPIPTPVLLGVLGAVVVGALTEVVTLPSWAPFLLSLPPAVGIGFYGGLDDVGWVRLLVAVTVWLGAPLAARSDGLTRGTSLGTIFLACSVAATWTTVPDTEEAIALLGAAVIPTLLAWPAGLLRLGRSGGAAAVTLLVWVAAIDGRGRPTSVIGSVVALGLLVMVPAVGRVTPSPVRSTGSHAVSARLGWALAVGVHLAIVLVAARVVGVMTDVALASISGAALAVIGLLVASWLAPTITAGVTGREPRSSSTCAAVRRRSQ